MHIFLFLFSCPQTAESLIPNNDKLHPNGQMEMHLPDFPNKHRGGACESASKSPKNILL